MLFLFGINSKRLAQGLALAWGRLFVNQPSPHQCALAAAEQALLAIYQEFQYLETSSPLPKSAPRLAWLWRASLPNPGCAAPHGEYCATQERRRAPHAAHQNKEHQHAD
jgi:hypothetical protein